jgi:hypothetical protein
MNERVKVMIGSIFTIVGVYVAIASDVRDHTRRLERVEKGQEFHIEKRETQLEKIDAQLSKIEIIMGRIYGD